MDIAIKVDFAFLSYFYSGWKETIQMIFFLKKFNIESDRKNSRTLSCLKNYDEKMKINLMFDTQKKGWNVIIYTGSISNPEALNGSIFYSREIKFEPGMFTKINLVENGIREAFAVGLK